MVHPRDFRVVIVESVLCPAHFRNTLARVLFNRLNVSMHIIVCVCNFSHMYCTSIYYVKVCVL